MPLPAQVLGNNEHRLACPTKGVTPTSILPIYSFRSFPAGPQKKCCWLTSRSGAVFQLFRKQLDNALQEWNQPIPRLFLRGRHETQT